MHQADRSASEKGAERERRRYWAGIQQAESRARLGVQAAGKRKLEIETRADVDKKQKRTEDEVGETASMTRNLRPEAIELIYKIYEIQSTHPLFCNQFASQPRLSMQKWELAIREFYICETRAADGMLDESQISGWCMLSEQQRGLNKELCVLAKKGCN
jgi:hypothetical protein